MHLNKLFFIFYRIIERAFSVRCESYILYGIFFTYYLVFFGRWIPQNATQRMDKRELWENHRFEALSGARDFARRIEECLRDGVVAFENTMETSIRGFHALDASAVSGFRVSLFLHLIYVTNLLCPDLYLKRVGLRLIDQSNNHQFYVLLYNFRFLKKYYRIDTSLTLLKFVEARIVGGLLNEGSTFYHLGVIGCINDLVKSGEMSKPDAMRFNQLVSCLESFEEQLHHFSNLNFGDRDGTSLVKNEVTHGDNLYKIPENVTGIMIKDLGNHSIIFFSKLESNGFGTGGHFHDDFGHFVLKKNNEIVVYDLGTFKYSYEPLHCRREFHNMPFFVETPGVEYCSRFVRTPRHHTGMRTTRYFTVFYSLFGDRSIRRYFLFRSRRIIDVAVGYGTVETLYALNSAIFRQGVASQSLLQFEFFNLEFDSESEGFYYPDYCIRRECKFYKLRWRIPSGSRVSRLMRLRLNV